MPAPPGRPAAAARPGRGDRVESAVLDERLARSGATIHATVLQHQPDPGPQRPPAGRGILPQDRDRAAVARAVALDDLDGRGLAGAVRPEQRHDLAATDRQGHAVEHGPRPVSLDDAIENDRRLAGCRAHGAILAYWRSKSSSSAWPIWIERKDALPVDEVRLRPRRDTVGRLERLVGIEDRRPGGPVLRDEVARRRLRIVGQDADDGQAVGLVLRQLREELRELVTAWDARGTPEVDDDRPAAERGQVERGAVERRADDRRRGLPDDGLRPATRRADEQHDGDQRHGRDGDREQEWVAVA